MTEKIEEENDNDINNNIKQPDIEISNKIKCLFIQSELICGELILDVNDSYAYHNIPDEKRASARNNFNISLDDEILFIKDTSFWNNVNQGMVITGSEIIFINDNDKPNDIERYKWKDIHHIEYKDLVLYFFLCDPIKEEPLKVYCSYFFQQSDKHRTNERRGEFIATVFTEAAQLAGNPDDIIEKIEKLINNSQYDDALQESLKAFDVIDGKDQNMNINFMYNQRGKIYRGLEKYNEARKDFANAMTKALNQEDRNENKKQFQEMDSIYINSFLSIKYSKRKLLVVVDEITDILPKNMCVMNINNLPDIHFPIGHPIANQLYVGHPYIANKYIPFENHELELIDDKIREFCEIMQYLGALEVKIETINRKGQNNSSKINKSIEVDVSYKVVGGKFSNNNERENNLADSIAQTINVSETFVPTQKPTLPIDLVWYHNEPSWQRLYKQRMQGGLLEHREKIETQKSKVVENSELTQIETEFKTLILSANIKWNQNMEQKFISKEDAEITIYVKFAPLESLS